MDVLHTTSGTDRQSPEQVTAAVRRLVVIDDDELSRAVVGLVAAEGGFAAHAFASGEDALEALEVVSAPFAVLADVQMPGVSGNELARRVREGCGKGTVLLAMSGSAVAKGTISEFDGFLLKPFTADELNAACERRNQAGAEELPHENGAASLKPAVLSLTIYRNLARSMSAEALRGLYKMCLDDVQQRVNTMRRAAINGDDEAYRRAAHAIKGGCGMVGAVELAGIAAAIESEGLPAELPVGPNLTPLDEFVSAALRLRRMLEAKAHEGPSSCC